MRQKISILLLVSLFLSIYSCANKMEEVSPEGEKLKKDITVPDFDKIDVKGDITLHLSTGESALSIETYENIFDYIEFYVYKGCLNIKIKNFVSFAGDPEIVVEISNLIYEKIQVSESAKLENTGKVLVAKELSLEVKDQARMNAGFEAIEISLDFENANLSELTLYSKKTFIELEGIEELRLGGTTDGCEINMKKSALAAFDFTANVVKAELREASYAKMTILKEIKAELYENSNFEVNGNPEINEIITHH